MTASEDHITTATHIIRNIGGLPFAYQRAVIRTDPDRLSDTLKEIEDVRKDPDSKLRNLRIKRHRDRKPGFLELTGSDVDAWEVRKTLRADRRFTGRVRLQPAYFVGMGTVRHGHGTDREGIYLAGLAPSARSKEPDLEGGRRPVVAVLDTPVREHPWLGSGEEDDAFWRDARRVGGAWAPDFEVPEEGVADGLLSTAGHGTFIAGMLRLLAPDARVLSVPVMKGDGVADDEHVLDALWWLRDRVSKAVDGRPERFVDVVNLSFGLYPDVDEDTPDSEAMRTVLGDLARLGVRVVASAGNEATDKRVFPAALSEESAPGDTELVSVGARDPDGTLAAYTSTGGWVSVEAPGTSVVSALPEFEFKPVVSPPKDVDANDEPTEPDPSFQASGIGQWSGTSFAAAWVSASIAAKLIEQATPGSLLDNSSAAAGARATSALDAVVADLEDWTASHGVVD